MINVMFLKVTPNVRTLVFHIDFIDTNGNVKKFSCQEAGATSFIRGGKRERTRGGERRDERKEKYLYFITSRPKSL